MRLEADFYDTDFLITYKGNRILVRNDGPEGESLYINDELQDQNFTAYDGHLVGDLMDEENNSVTVEVYLTGMRTENCQIYVDGKLYHSNLRTARKIDLEPEQNQKEKKKNGLFFPFLMIMLIAVLMIFLIPMMEKGHPSDNPSKTLTEKEAESNSNAAQQKLQESRRTTSQYIEVKYSWDYGGGTWTYHLKIPKSAYEYYKTVNRDKIRNYSYYVTDSTDDEYLAGLAEKFKEAAQKENYSDLDMVKNIIFFVQNLEYVDDKVGTGYDEYPKFPLETLADQGGDCEDSAILLASLLRELGYGAVLVQFQNHMGVGVKGEDTMPGSYYEIDGTHYYYVETTSPGWEIGEIPDQMKDQRAKILTLN